MSIFFLLSLFGTMNLTGNFCEGFSSTFGGGTKRNGRRRR